MNGIWSYFGIVLDDPDVFGPVIGIEGGPWRTVASISFVQCG